MYKFVNISPTIISSFEHVSMDIEMNSPKAQFLPQSFNLIVPMISSTPQKVQFI